MRRSTVNGQVQGGTVIAQAAVHSYTVAFRVAAALISGGVYRGPALMNARTQDTASPQQALSPEAGSARSQSR